MQKFVKTPRFESFLLLTEARKLIQEIRDAATSNDAKAKPNQLENEKEMDANLIILKQRLPKLAVFLEREKDLDPQILETLKKYGYDEIFLPHPIMPNFLLKLFEAAEKAEIPKLKADYMELIKKTQKPAFAELKEISEFLRRFNEPNAAFAGCAYILNFFGRSYYFDSNKELFEKSKTAESIEETFKTYGKFVETYSPSGDSVKGITDNFIAFLCDNCPNLKTLNLKNCTEITPRGLATLKEKKSIENLALGKLKVYKNKNRELIQLLKTFPNLKKLDLLSFYPFERTEITDFKDLKVEDLTIKVRFLQNGDDLIFFMDNTTLKKLDIFALKVGISTCSVKKLVEARINTTLHKGKESIAEYELQSEAKVLSNS